MIRPRGCGKKTTMPLRFIGEFIERMIFRKFAFIKINYQTIERSSKSGFFYRLVRLRDVYGTKMINRRVSIDE